SVNGAPAKSSTTTDEYHLADVIFTIGTDDLSDVDGNTLEKNAAYNYFKTYVADAGKLSAEELAEFNSATVEEFNEAFVASYYEAAEEKLGSDLAGSAAYAAPLPILSYSATSGVQAPKRFFGFFFKMFNPMTYMSFMMNMIETVMTWALAQMFKMMLMSGTMTKLMLRLAIKFPILTSIMIHVLSSYWGITSRMIPYLMYDKEFGQLFAQLAYEQPKMAHFFFQNIDAPLYNALTHAMLLSQETTERLAIMMNWYAKAYLVIPSQKNPYDAFTSLLFDTRNNVIQSEDGNLTGHGDGSELANERFYYALFQSPLATEQFIKAMQQVDAIEETGSNGLNGHDTVVAFMDFIFLGAQNTNVYTPKLDLNADRMQGTFNIFAIAQGMLSGIEKFGFEAYLQNFVDFAMLMPPERYLDYGMAFGMAGYTYYTQAVFEGEGEPTMMDFMGFLMGAVQTQLATCDDTEIKATFGSLLQALDPYIQEFMQNGMPNMSMPNLEDSNASVIIEGDVNQTITTPLEQQAKVIPNPTALIQVIENFPVLWEKDYSDGGFEGDRISNDPFGYYWSEMPEELANLNWMQIPYPNNFVPSSYFNFIFENGTVDMYVFIKQSEVPFIGNIITQYGLSDVTPSSNVSARNQFNQGVNFKVYKLTVHPGDKLYVNNLIQFQRVTGVAFDLSGAVPEATLPTGEAPTEPLEIEAPIVEPIDPPEAIEIPNTLVPDTPEVEELPEPEPVVEPDPEPEVIVPEPDPEPEPEPEPIPEPTVVTLTDIISGLPTTWVKDYSGTNYQNHYVTNEYNEKWLSMSSFMSGLNWIEIPKYFNFSYSDVMHFNEATTIYFITQNNSKSNFEWLIDQEGALTAVSESITSSDNWDTFYVYKMDVPAGYNLSSLHYIKSNTSGIAFYSSAITTP
ncbi:MAG TPA: hypothetical protein ENK65_02320, partial [Helicobacteraceae bacterium]|nr:hypothetical protein [Helicobacteraceae bacterium]